ncbi:uncharacterized protein LOC125098866 isoform X1 [Lutra lutra]|uniref:uncharacterized protein LOC125098866 isoform X1 n=1 Tax=Lutra lutra TaxID=9657 RepID=UPI001FCFCF10|nr:uncharacterized protein LOC125098866 isoform X1 [Lutra lutra]
MLAQAPTLAPHMRILWGDGGHLLWLAGLLLYLATVFFSIFMSFRALLSHSLPASLEVQEHPLGPPPGPQWLPGRGSDAQGSLPGEPHPLLLETAGPASGLHRRLRASGVLRAPPRLARARRSSRLVTKIKREHYLVVQEPADNREVLPLQRHCPQSPGLGASKVELSFKNPRFCRCFLSFGGSSASGRGSRQYLGQRPQGRPLNWAARIKAL